MSLLGVFFCYNIAVEKSFFGSMFELFEILLWLFKSNLKYTLLYHIQIRSESDQIQDIIIYSFDN